MRKITGERSDSAGRMMGLGAGPSDDAFQKTTSCAFMNVPVLEFVTWTVSLPLLDSTLSQTFGEEIDVLTGPKQVPGIAAVDSSFSVNGILQTDMFAVGIGVHIFGEPMTFSQIGNSVPTSNAPAQPPISPDVWTASDLANGALGPTTGVEPAAMEWGLADWQAAWHMANAYQFNWRVMQRLYLIQELCADVCYFGPYAEGIGMGTSDAVVQQYVNQINGTYKGLGQTSSFLPVTHRRVGSVNTGPTTYATHGNIGVFHPTNDYKLAPVSWGGLRNQGTQGVQTPFRKLNRPVRLPRGVPIGISLNAVDSYHYSEMLRYMSISENNTAAPNAVASVSVGGGYAGFTASPAISATAAAGLELTLDTGGNQFAQQSVDTDTALFKGGTLKLAILIKGFEVPGPWSDYFSSRAATMSHLIDQPSGSAGVGGLTAGR